MDERLSQHDADIAEVKNILTSHIDDENHQVLELRKDLNGNLIKIHAALLRMEPVISKYENEQIFNEGVKKVGSKVIWWSQVLGGSGVLVYAVRAFIRNGF